MPSLLISVTNEKEAQMAIDGGADIIDLKDPSNGALGALPVEVITAVVQHVSGRRKTSATIGDTPMEAGLINTQVRAFMQLNLDYIKIGFFKADNYMACINSLAALIQKGAKLIAVLFAEYRYPPSLIKALKQAGFVGIMLDTSVKNNLTMFDHYSESELIDFSQSVSQHDMLLGLAGSLNKTHLPRLSELNPSYLGFRGGVCDEGDRKQHLKLEKIKALSKLM